MGEFIVVFSPYTSDQILTLIAEALLTPGRRTVTAALRVMSHRIARTLAGELLHRLGNSPPANAKTREGESHPDREAQFALYALSDEHALTSQQEHEAWDVLLACQGQLRLAPSGQVIGIDMDAALRLGAARGCDLAVLDSCGDEGS